MEKPQDLLQPCHCVMRAPQGVFLQSKSAKTLVDVRSGLKFAKSPRWTGQKLMFLDIHDRCIRSADLNGIVNTVLSLPFLPSGLEVLDDGGLVVGDAWRRKIYRFDQAHSSLIADLSDVARFCLSDNIVSNRGDIYVGDMGFDFLDPLVNPVPTGVIVHVPRDASSRVVADNLFLPNGMIITPDNRTLIVAESLAHRLTAFDIQDDGSLRNRRVWAQFQEDVKPDGICLDREGAVWVAAAGPRALRIREGGEIDYQVTTERPVFAIMLGGPDQRHLFLCTSASHDPVITHHDSNATIDIVEVNIPDSGAP